MKITVDMALACEVTASFDGIGIDVAVELSKPCCALENVSVANVTNDTTPEATDKIFLWRAVKGWFYVYWQKLVSIFFAGGGFKANLYFTARDSDVAGYNLLSYQNDATATTLTATLGADYTLLRSYIFNLPYGDSTIPEGLWKSILYGMVSSAAGDTTLRLDGFMRTGAGVETQIFSVESSSIKNTTLDDIPNEQWLPQLTVDPDSYFGVKLYGKTTKGGGVTLTTVVGGANASYLITPAAFEHNLTRRRDVADCHPANAITFDVDPVPDFTAVAKGNNLQQVTNKVAGLQENILVDYTLTENAASVTIELDEPVLNHIVLFSGTLCDVDGTPKAGRLYYYLNSLNSDWFRHTSAQATGVEAVNANKTSINSFWLTLVSHIIQGISSAYSDDSSDLYYPVNYYNISNVNSVVSITVGSRISPLMKAGSNIKIYKL